MLFCLKFQDVANAWFHAKERFFAVTVGVFSNTFGTGVGYLVSPLIVGDNPVHLFFRVFYFIFWFWFWKEKIGDLNFISAILLTIPLALCLAFVKEKPKCAPNMSNVTFFQNVSYFFYVCRPWWKQISGNPWNFWSETRNIFLQRPLSGYASAIVGVSSTLWIFSLKRKMSPL